MLLFSIFAFVATFVLLPILLGELMSASLGRLWPEVGRERRETVIASIPAAASCRRV